jgi:class 3 adenylate cyclase/pimeloyl-ACP methyl ester carboxylesterase
MEDRLARKLAAILYADVAGYSRLTGEDEDATHRTLSEYLDLIASTITKYGGVVVHYAGDAVLAMFPAVYDAVSSAVAIQTLLSERNQDIAEARRIQFRIGINLGDIIEDRGDIYGDGVNVAARLEALAEPGGICISDLVRQSVMDRIEHPVEDLGEREVKNIARPIRCFAIVLDAVKKRESHSAFVPTTQDIRFCTASDGVELAYATTGQGPPIVKTANWLNHLAHDWLNPVWGHLIRSLAQDHTFIRYDQRGNGLSDWEAEDMSFASWVDDLEVVVNAAGLEKFALLGMSQGCAVSIAYAARHPERVTHLILHGGYAKGVRIEAPPEVVAKHEAMLTLIREGWTQDNPAFRQMFTSILIPDATEEQAEWFTELTRVATSPEMAVRLFDEFSYIDVRDQLAMVKAPTLVTHSREDARIPFQMGRELAAQIPNARFVPLESRNHMILQQDKAKGRFLSELLAFLQPD